MSDAQRTTESFDCLSFLSSLERSPFSLLTSVVMIGSLLSSVAEYLNLIDSPPKPETLG